MSSSFPSMDSSSAMSSDTDISYCLSESGMDEPASSCISSSDVSPSKYSCSTAAVCPLPVRSSVSAYTVLQTIIMMQRNSATNFFHLFPVLLIFKFLFVFYLKTPFFCFSHSTLFTFLLSIALFILTSFICIPDLFERSLLSPRQDGFIAVDLQRILLVSHAFPIKTVKH